MRIRNKDIPQWNLPPELVSNVIKFLNIFLVENSHVVQALPPFSPDHRHVLPQRHGTPALHCGTIHYPQPPVWAGLQPNSPPHVKSFRTKWRRGTHTHTNKQTNIRPRLWLQLLGKGGRSVNKRKPNGAMNLHLRGDVTTPGADLFSSQCSQSFLAFYFPGHPFESSGDNSRQFLT